MAVFFAGVSTTSGLWCKEIENYVFQTGHTTSSVSEHPKQIATLLAPVTRRRRDALATIWLRGSGTVSRRYVDGENFYATNDRRVTPSGTHSRNIEWQ